MFEDIILEEMRGLRKTIALLTDPRVAHKLGNVGYTEKRLSTLAKAETRMENLEFAYEMVSAPVAEPERIIYRGNV